MFDELADTSASNPSSGTTEQRMDDFAELAKEATQLAAKIRTSLNTIAQNARAGTVSSAPSQLSRVSEALAGLSSTVERLGDAEQSMGLRGPRETGAEYARELEAALATKGVAVAKGPDPYWLAYPAWYKVERSSKGAIEVILNGDKLDSVRPTVVADAVADVVNEKFNAKQFSELLGSVRQLLRRAGAGDPTLRLEDLYEVLALEPGKRASRRKDFSKGAFYYSVHRLAEELDRAPSSFLDFPSSDRSEVVFFTRQGESRRYLTVEFAGARL